MTRLTAALMVTSLMRRTQIEGGSAVMVRKGDPTSGTILILCLEKGCNSALCERLLTPSGAYEWQRVGPQDIDKIDELDAYIQRRVARDPDLWVIELDVPNAERLIAETGAEG